MKTEKIHSVKPFLCGLIIFSLIGHLAIPFSTQAKKAAFSQWLSYNMISSDHHSDQDLRNTILDLPSHSQNFEILVKQASELIADHKEKFSFNLGQPFDGGTDQRMSNLLIDQWSVFNSQKTGQLAVIPDLVQPVNKWLPAKSISLFYPESILDRTAMLQKPSFTTDRFRPPATTMEPLVSGFSIHSP